MTFLEIVQKQGYKSINEYLDDVEPIIQNLSDLSETQMRKIRRNESATEAFLGATA